MSLSDACGGRVGAVRGACDASSPGRVASGREAFFAERRQRAERLDLDALTHLVLALARTVAANHREDYAMALAIERSIILSRLEHDPSDDQCTILALFEQLCDAVVN